MTRSTDDRIRAAERALAAAKAEAERLETKPDGLEGQAWITALCAARDEAAEAQGRLVAEHLRSGKRDPRRCPVVGDVLQVAITSGSPLAMNVVEDGVSWHRRRVFEVYRSGRAKLVRWVCHPRQVVEPKPDRGGCHLESWRRWARLADVLQLGGGRFTLLPYQGLAP